MVAPYLKTGRTFRRGNKLVRYVYRGSKRIGLEVVRSMGKGAKRYIAYKTYDRLKTYGPRRFFNRRFT